MAEPQGEGVALSDKNEGVIEKHKDSLTANIGGTGDLVIELKYCKWAVDQKKFESASKFFRVALQGGQWKEGREHYIKLHDDNPIIFARYIQFIYDATYKNDDPLECFFRAIVCSVTSSLRGLILGESIYELDIDLGFSGGRCGPGQNESNEADTFTIKERADMKGRADLREDTLKSGPQIDLEVYQLADKYGISSLQDYALSRFKGSIVTCPHEKYPWKVMFSAAKKLYPDLEMMDEKVKRAVSLGIESNYKMLREATDDDAAEIRQWLQSDHELCFSVMDQLGKGIDLKKDLDRSVACFCPSY